MKKTHKRMTAAQRREARNQYSREWKRKHKKQVKAWNSKWYAAQKKVARAKSKAAAKRVRAEEKVAA